MTLCGFDDSPGDLAVGLLRHAHTAERIATMRVEAGGKEDRVRLVVVDDADDLIFDNAKVARVSLAAGQRNIRGEPATLSDADLAGRARSRIERIAVHRCVV